MRIVVLLLLSLLLDGAVSCKAQEQQHDPELLVLGMVPPGLIAEVFAPGLVSRESDEGGAVIHPEGTEIYFWAVRGGEGQGRSTIYQTKLEAGSWTNPKVSSFSGTYSDGYIAMHPDGSRLFFQSDRPIDKAESTFKYNLWYVDRVGEGWSEAKSAGRPVNGANHTGGASVARGGTLYYTIMDIATGGAQIYRSRYVDGVYQEPERLPEPVNRRHQTTDSYVAPDESYIIFTAFERQGHEDNPGTVYISFRDESGEWTEARAMGPAINSEDQFGSVTISPDGRYLFFPRYNASAGMGLDIYWIDSGIVDE